MFERLQSFIKAMGELIHDPNLLEDYRSLLSTASLYTDEMSREKKKLQESYDQVNAELSFRKTMEAEGIAVGQSYIDKELGPELLLDRPWETQGQTTDVRVSYIKVMGFTVENRKNFIETNLGKVKAERFLDRRSQGKLITIEQSIREDDRRKTQPKEPKTASTTLSHMPGYKELLEKMREAGFIPADVPESNDLLMWKDIQTGKELALDDWQQVKDFLAEIEQGMIVGMLFYAGGDVQWFEDPENYVRTYEEEISYRGPTGVFARTITRDPAVRKAIDDKAYGAFGEENPNELAHYVQQKNVPGDRTMEQEADGMEL